MSPKPRRRGLTMVAAILVVLVAAGAAVLYLINRGNTKFSSIPPVCETIQPIVARLGAYELKPTPQNRSCDLWLPRDNPAFVAAPKITVGFYAEVDGPDQASTSVSDMMREIAKQGESVSGLGAEAFRQDRNYYFRVSNLIVAILVFPNPASTDLQVRRFAEALAARLDS